MQAKVIVLSIEQARTVVCCDLKQYDPQIALMAEILVQLFDEEQCGGAVLETDDTGLWVRTPKSRRPRRIAAHQLAEHLCGRLMASDLSLETWITICRRVFQTPAHKIRESDDSPWCIAVETGMHDFVCRQCGRCCRRLDYRHLLAQKDVRLWREKGRDDILAWVASTRQTDGKVAYQIWVEPGTHRFAEDCPFLKQGQSNHLWICSIHDVKPTFCRQYPLTRKHALMTGCIGFRGWPKSGV